MKLAHGSIDASRLHAGDVLAFSGTSCLSRGIRLCTLGPISHVGILAESEDGDLWLYEALIDEGVTRHRWQRAVERCVMRGGKVWHYELTRPLSRGKSCRLSDFLERQMGVPYDRWGAIRARTLGFGWLRYCGWLPSREDLGNWFCNELCGAGLRDVDRFNDINVSRYNPTSFCRAEVQQGHFQQGQLIAGGMR